MIKQLGIAFMGSKRKIAPKLVEFMLQENPNCKYFYDLFGGGGAVSFIAMQHPQIKQVFYNEIDVAICKLLVKIRNEGVTDEFFQWIDRETFHSRKGGNDWIDGLIKTCWSFGSNQITYLYGKNVEKVKKEATDYLFANGYDKTVKTRIALLKEFKKKNSIEERLDLENLAQVEHLKQIQHLSRVEHLKQIQHLERIASLHITNQSYQDVLITTPSNETVIYSDIPYQTEECIKRHKKEENYYSKFDFNKFVNWFNQSPYKIYVSSYDFPAKECFTTNKVQTLCAKNNRKVVEEKLYCNR